VSHLSALAAATLAVAGLAVAGCGSSSSSGGSAAGGYPSASTASASTTPASAGGSATGAANSGAAASGTVLTTEHASQGTVLAAGPKHLTVYLFEADKGSTSSCSGACAQVWPPVTTSGAPKTEGGAVAGDVGTTTRSDGTKQLTYKGHPLYYYVSDQHAGETTGQGSMSFGAGWYVLSPQGSKIE
jgi:predicted lipoprotein with Yx(FWY)xxD motif